MFKIKGIHYFNDYTKDYFEESFNSLDGIYNWLVKNSGNFASNYGNYFPEFRNSSIDRISISDVKNRGWLFWIHQIETEDGIVFSTGKFTNGKSFCASKVKDWIIDCDKKLYSIKNEPKFIEI